MKMSHVIIDIICCLSSAMIGFYLGWLAKEDSVKKEPFRILNATKLAPGVYALPEIDGGGNIQFKGNTMIVDEPKK